MDAFIEANYIQACTRRSDINEHVSTLSNYAEQCNTVCEFGVRTGVSTWGFARGLLKKVRLGQAVRLNGYDLDAAPQPYKQLNSSIMAGFEVAFHQGSDLKIAPVSCDLLFIDTFHVYGQLKRELALHADGVRKFIIMHDTTVDEWDGELRREGWDADTYSKVTEIPANELLLGLWPAVTEFLASHSEWVLHTRYTNNNGLTVLARVSVLPPIETLPTHPIGFSIPECKIVTSVPCKTKQFSHIVPGDLSTYIFTDETSYYADYCVSTYGRTCRKGEWDCLRHYEILAAGCIPWFVGLQNCHEKTMTHFPKELVHAGMDLGGRELNDPAIQEVIEKLLAHTRAHLTTKAMASYMLHAAGFGQAKSVLYLSGALEPDYLRCLTLHGLKEIFKGACHDYPAVPHLYTDCETPSDKLYGRGFTYSKLLDKSVHRNADLDATVQEDIASRKYDVIVYGSVNRRTPFWELVNEHYGKHEILLLFGEDAWPWEVQAYPGIRAKYDGYHFFRREYF
jgi:hypothetical protein